MPKFLEVTDKVAARGYLTAGLDEVIYVEDYRDGIRTDGEIIAAAFADLQSGGALRFGQGVTYSISSGLLIQLDPLSDFVIDGQGATLVGQSGLTGTVLSVRGVRYGSTNTTLTAAVTSRSDTLTVADTTAVDGSGTSWAAGDMIAIRSSAELFSPDYTTPGNSEKQEMGRVKSVPDSTTITLTARTWNTYALGANTVTVQRYAPIRNVVIKDLNIVGAGAANLNQSGLDVRHFDGLLIDNVSVDGTNIKGISMSEGLDFVGVDCRAQNMQSSQGYGLVSGLVHGVKWLNCYGFNNRHTFDAYNCRDLVIDGCTAESNVSAGISTHGGCDAVRISNCMVRECGGGIIVRGVNNTIIGNHILGTLTSAESATTSQPSGATYRSGIVVGQGSSTNDGVSGTNLVIDSNVIDVSGPTYTGTEGDTTGQCHGIRLHAPMVNARIVNNTIKGFPNNGIYSIADFNTGVQIAGNVIDCSSQFAGSEPIKCGVYLKPTQGTAAQTFITVTDNDIRNGAIHSGIYIAGGATGTRSDHLYLRDNVIGSCGTAKIYVDDDYYGSSSVIFGNNTNDVDYTAANWTALPFIQDPTTLTVGFVDVSGSVTLSAIPGRQYAVRLASGAAPTMPTAVGNTSIYLLKNCHTSNITVATTSTQTIEGQSSLVLRAGAATTLISDGSNWRTF